MPPVVEWRTIRFGPDIISKDSNRDDTLMAAEVVCPSIQLTDLWWQANEDANNGELFDGNEAKRTSQIEKFETDNGKSLDTKQRPWDGIPLSSSESVGHHLAQKIFCQILYYDALV